MKALTITEASALALTGVCLFCVNCSYSRMEIMDFGVDVWEVGKKYSEFDLSV